MAVQNPASYLGTEEHPVAGDRRLLAALFGESAGVVEATGLLVTEKSGTPNMSVDVATGRVVMKGTEATYQGSYLGDNQGTTNKTISAADPTNPRRDLVIAYVADSQYSGADNKWDLAVVTGTPAGSPVDPTPSQDNYVLLARVAVAAGATSITNANITDLRPRAFLHTGVAVCTSTTRPSSPWEGFRAFEADTNRDIIYTGAEWVQLNTVVANVDTSQATTSASYTDLATVGPAVSALTGAKALVTLSAEIDNSGVNVARMGVDITGATTLAVADARALYKFNTGGEYVARQVYVAALTPGVNTFTAKYLVTGGTGTFGFRHISVVPIL